MEPDIFSAAQLGRLVIADFTDNAVASWPTDWLMGEASRQISPITRVSTLDLRGNVLTCTPLNGAHEYEDDVVFFYDPVRSGSHTCGFESFSNCNCQCNLEHAAHTAGYEIEYSQSATTACRVGAEATVAAEVELLKARATALLSRAEALSTTWTQIDEAAAGKESTLVSPAHTRGLQALQLIAAD